MRTLTEFRAAVVNGLPPFSTWAWDPYIRLCWGAGKTVNWTRRKIAEAADFEICSIKNNK
jgi:hypothetical protein